MITAEENESVDRLSSLIVHLCIGESIKVLPMLRAIEDSCIAKACEQTSTRLEAAHLIGIGRKDFRAHCKRLGIRSGSKRGRKAKLLTTSRDVDETFFEAEALREMGLRP